MRSNSFQQNFSSSGVVSSGEILGSSLHLLTSFQVPIISINELDPMHSPRSTLFTVASSLKYLSKAVVGLLNKLNWSQATLVVSDEVPLYYTKILEEISLKVRFNVQNSPSSSSSSSSSSDGKAQKPNHRPSSQSPVSLSRTLAVRTRSLHGIRLPAKARATRSDFSESTLRLPSVSEHFCLWHLALNFLVFSGVQLEAQNKV